MLESLHQQAIAKILAAQTLLELEQIRVELFSKNSPLNIQVRKLSELTLEDRKSFGQKINSIKAGIESAFHGQKAKITAAESEARLKKEKLDVSLPGRIRSRGSIHPLTQAQAELTQIFTGLGFKIEEGPDIETDWYNFTALNIPAHHPARQMHDTFYLPNIDIDGINCATHSDEGRSNEQQKILLRTQTSPVQIRTMERYKPPLRFIAPGRTYRSDYDQTHTPMFHQIEGVAVQEGLNMGHLKFTIIKFVKSFFEGQKIDIRFRPSFFPFTEPSVEVDILFQDQVNASWLEVLGGGMIHPKILENCNIDYGKYQGFAFGMGLERMAMLKYGIRDLRQFFESDMRWLNHYSFSSFDIPSLAGGLTR